MKWVWQSNDYDCTAASELNERQLPALGIRLANDSFTANAPRLPASGQTYCQTLKGAQRLPNKRTHVPRSIG